MADIIDRSLTRAIRYFRHDTLRKIDLLRASLDRLANDFERPATVSPNSSDLTTWRDLQAKIELQEEIHIILEAIGEEKDIEIRNNHLKRILGNFKAKKERAQAAYEATCLDLARDFRRPRGPAGLSGAEASWIIYRAQVMVYVDLEEKLFDAWEALGLLPEEA